MPVTLAAKLRKSHFLFLGYGLRDWNMRVILHRIAGEQRLTYKSWAIQRASDRPRSEVLGPSRRRHPRYRSRRATSPHLQERHAADAAAAGRPPRVLEYPYAGLMPFTEEQAPFFFGRDARARDHRGQPDGVAADAVLRPERRRQELGPQRRRGRTNSAAEADRQPLHGAAPQIRHRRVPQLARRPLAGLERTIDRESWPPATGATFADRLRRSDRAIDGDVLIILDQFEEYFMYHTRRGRRRHVRRRVRRAR